MLTRPGFDEYVSMRSSVLLRFAYLVCGDRHLAEDLVQEVLIRAHRRWDTIEAENPDAYLKKAITRAYASRRRRRASSEIVTETLPDAPQTGAFDEVQAARDEAWVLLATLPPVQRAVLVLRYFEDLDDERIAELVGTTRGAVRVNAHRGLHRLRETLTARAQEVPVSTELARDVQAGVARRARRRAAILGGLAGVVVVALLVAVFVILRPTGREPGPIDPTPSTTSEVALVPAVPPAGPDFPYAFGWLPSGYAGPHVGVSEEFGYVSATFSEGPGGRGLTVYVGDEPQLVDSPADQTIATTVNGVAATARIIQFCIDLVWPRDGQIISIVSCPTALTLDEIRRVAEGITAGTTASMPAQSSIAAVSFPEGYEVTTWEEPVVCAQGPLGEICVSVSKPSGTVPADDAPLQIDGLPATDADGQLRVFGPDDRMVVVSAPGGDLALRVAIFRTVRLV